MILRNLRAGKHKFLPYQNTHAVAIFIEAILFINTAAPDPEHIEIRISGTFDQFEVLFILQSAGHALRWNPVASPAEDRPAVDTHHELKIVPIHNGPVQLHLSEAKGPPTLHHIIRKMLTQDVFVDRLFPVAVRPPQLRLIHVQIRHQLFS